MLDNFVNLLSVVEEEVNKIEESNIIIDSENNNNNYGVIYDTFEKENLFFKSTNFHKTTIFELYFLFF